MRRVSMVVCALALGVPSAASAFCGFYVGGGDASLFNDATMVVMLRDGTRTVLSMQNNYQGPPEAFAMVIPVPEVLDEDHVKTLPHDIFDHVDRMAAPRLVEYWEQDPCNPQQHMPRRRMMRRRGGSTMSSPGGAAPDLGVVVEAEFTVGEYEIVILSANDSSGLETWLHREGYNIPQGAQSLLRPYVESGMKFFVAKVDITKVQTKNVCEGAATEGCEQAMLSPLRFYYDTDTFSLPIRLGLMNSRGKQDLIVHILARNQRYEVANYPNTTIPTNIDVAESVQETFGEFYTALFDETLARNPRAVVTEYSWQATSCDPCPGPQLTMSDIMTLGADVAPSMAGQLNPAIPPGMARRRRPSRRRGGSDFVLTRLHARYDADDIGEDLVFRVADAIVGGRERRNGGVLEQDVQLASSNNFQGRYAIRHPWTGPVECESPQHGVWGGPPGSHGQPPPRAARNLAFVQRGDVKLSEVVRSPLPRLGLAGVGGVLGAGAQSESATQSPTPVTPVAQTASSPTTATDVPPDGGCNCDAAGGHAAWFGVVCMLVWTRQRLSNARKT